MFPEFVRSVREIRPKAFVIENVKGLLRPAFANYFSYVLLQLQHPDIRKSQKMTWQDHLKRLEKEHTSTSPQYNVVFRVLNAADYGVPQCRHRVFIVGFRRDVSSSFTFPEPTHSRESLLWSIHTGEYQDRHRVQLRSKIGSLRDRPNTLPWVTIRDAVSDLPRVDSTMARQINHISATAKARVYPGHTGSNFDEPAKTIKAGVHGVPGGENMIVFPNGQMRYMTVREAARIQTFPDNWEIAGPWSEGMRQMGNAVPVKLAKSVLESVVSHLNKRAHAN